MCCVSVRAPIGLDSSLWMRTNRGERRPRIYEVNPPDALHRAFVVYFG